MSRLDCISVGPAPDPDGGGSVEVLLLEPRPFRPFKSSEEYLIAMKEDLAEWLQRLYSPQLNIDCDNFMDVLEDGVVLCKHANNVRKTAVAYKEKLEQQGQKRRKFSTHWDVPDLEVLYRSEVKSKSFFARDNVHNFIQWCRLLGIYECLLFETDDLVLRKNEKSFILCLLEVARRGAHFGMPAPMLVQFEKEIDRELAKDGEFDVQDEDEDNDEELLVEYGPVAQIILNDLRSLDEMVRDLVAVCSCPTQFPMIRISEGKYRIGDTKTLIFVRILKQHVMVRVGGGWDTLSHFLEKHDPCRCRAGHRTPVASKLSVSLNSRGTTDMAVSYERSSLPRSSSPPPPCSTSRRSSSASVNGPATPVGSRKNSINSLTATTSSGPSHPDSSFITRFRPRQRSPSPSANKFSMRQRSQSPASPPIFQRTGSGRYNWSHCQYGQTPSAYEQQQNAYTSPQANLDSLESYDSGLGRGSPSDRRRSSKSFQKQPQPSKEVKTPLEDPAAIGIASANGIESCTNCGGDSSSEVSDEGYRTGSVSVSKSDEIDERPDSSCTQASSQSSSAESGVSSVSAGVAKKPATAATTAPAEDLTKKSKIPFLGSLRGLGKVSFQQHRNRHNSGDLRQSDNSGGRSGVSRSSSISSDTSSLGKTSSRFGCHRDNFGRHSLRIRGEGERIALTSSRSRTSPVQQQMNASTGTGRILMWNGSHNKRQRPALSPELFNTSENGINEKGTVMHSSALNVQQHQHSRANGLSSSKQQPRASSISPTTRKSYYGNSMASSSNTTGQEDNVLCLNSTSTAQMVNDTPTESCKMSPLLRSMLKDVEVDNDASILKKMEEIVNQYKARVECILAQEGKTLNDEWEPTHCSSYEVERNIRRSSAPFSSRLIRSNSFDSSLPYEPPPMTARVYPSRRKDNSATSSSSPSKIPVPLFYRPKETCL